tara:strand:+ start:526 stop:903 length:378 start_codon:yes stop_codon:yes gene_type:complete
MAFRTPKSIERDFTRKFKADIRRKDLIDTFALYRSIQITAEIDLNFGTFMSANYTFSVQVFAEPYLVYLDERFQVTNDFINSRSFQNTTDKFRLFFTAYLQNEYPLLRFDNVTLELSTITLMNQP